MVKRINRDQTGQSVSVQVKSISKSKAANTELPKKKEASRIIGPASSTFTKKEQHNISLSLLISTRPSISILL